MATPFSPFVGRLKRPVLKRRQSELPSDLIDWDAPEIPELEKQRIIYEDYIKEMGEERDIETLLNEEIFRVAYDTVVESFQMKVNKLEDEISKERSKVNLLLGQIKMSENNIKENNDRIDELEGELTTQKNLINDFRQEKENWAEEKHNWDEEKNLWIEEKNTWIEEKNALKTEIENLNFRNNENMCEFNHNLEIYIQKKNEAEDYKKKLEGVKNQLAHYKRLAKNKGKTDDFE